MAETETPEITRVTAAILINDEKIIIAKRKSTGKLPNKWEFPGGKIEIDETPEQCLKRGTIFRITPHSMAFQRW